MSPAAGIREIAEVTNTQIETPLCQRSHKLRGAAINSQFNQLPVTILINCVAADGMPAIMGQDPSGAVSASPDSV
jgi:hypothetical protein